MIGITELLDRIRVYDSQAIHSVQRFLRLGKGRHRPEREGPDRPFSEIPAQRHNDSGAGREPQQPVQNLPVIQAAFRFPDEGLGDFGGSSQGHIHIR